MRVICRQLQITVNPPFKGTVDAESINDNLKAVCDTKKTELLYVALFLRMLKKGGRCACIVPDGVLFGSSKAHKALRKELIERHQLRAVISMPSGVFKPYAGVSTAVLVFTKTGTGGTENVWFYDMKADGFSLDDKRSEVAENDIPDILARFCNLDAETGRARTEQSFFVPKQEIAENDYDLSVNKYKKTEYVAVEYPPTSEILVELDGLYKELGGALTELGDCWMSKWGTVKLGDVCLIERGGSPRPIDQFITDDEDGINWIKIGDTDNTKYITKTEQKIIKEGMKKSRYVKAGDFLLSNSMSFGRPYILKIDGCIHDGWLVIRDENNTFDKDYLYYCLSSPIMFAHFKSLAVGGVVNNLNSKMVRDVYVSLPPLETQKQIAATLDKATQTIDLCNAILEKLDLLVKARFVEMFGDIYTNNHNYLICYLADFIDFLTSGSRGWAQYCVDDGSEWFITIKNVKDCRITTDNIQPVNAPDNMEAKRTKVKEGDLLISITADLGRTGVVTKEIAEHGAYINQHLTCIRLDQSKINPLFVAYFMESASGKPQFEAKNQTGVKAGLNFDSIKTLKLLVPPLELQNQFAAFVEKTDRTKAAVKQVLAKAETLKKALMQEYFG